MKKTVLKIVSDNSIEPYDLSRLPKIENPVPNPKFDKKRGGYFVSDSAGVLVFRPVYVPTKGLLKDIAALPDKYNPPAQFRNNYKKSYGCWQNMKTKSKSFEKGLKKTEFYYNGSLEHFVDFLLLVGPHPNDLDPSLKELFSLDRINSKDRIYSPDRVRWTVGIIQAENKAKTIWVTFENRRLTLAGWSKLLGIAQSTLTKRYLSGDKGGYLLRLTPKAQKKYWLDRMPLCNPDKMQKAFKASGSKCEYEWLGLYIMRFLAKRKQTCFFNTNKSKKPPSPVDWQTAVTYMQHVFNSLNLEYLRSSGEVIFPDMVGFKGLSFYDEEAFLEAVFYSLGTRIERLK